MTALDSQRMPTRYTAFDRGKGLMWMFAACGCTLAGCSQAEFGASVRLPKERHATLVDDFASGKPLVLPGDAQFNLTDTQRSASAGGNSTSFAHHEGDAGCLAEVSDGGAASAEFQLGHVIDNRATDAMAVTARFDVTYECELSTARTDREDSEATASLGLRVFVRDTDGRVIGNMMITQADAAKSGPRSWTGRQTPAFDLEMQPGLAYYFVLAGIAATETDSATAEASIKVSDVALELIPRRN